MRRRTTLLIVALLILSLLAGCSGGSKTPSGSTGTDNTPAPATGTSANPNENPWKPGDKTDLILATGGTGGTYYPLGGGMAKLWQSISGVNVTVQSTAASVANIRMLAKGEVDLALIQNDTADYGRNGTEAFAEKNEKYTNYLAVGVLYPEVVQIVVRADSNIQSITDLKGKKVVVGAPGSGTELASRQIFGAYGLTYMDKKDMEPLFISFAEGAAAIKEKQADALVMVTGVPAASLADVVTVTPIRLVPIEVDKVKSQYKFYVNHTVKANTYKGMDKDVNVVAVLAMLVASDKMNSDLVYEMTKLLYEKAGDIGHAKASEFDVSKAAEGVTIPFHPGAAKYLKEKGINVP